MPKQNANFLNWISTFGKKKKKSNWNRSSYFLRKSKHKNLNKRKKKINSRFSPIEICALCYLLLLLSFFFFIGATYCGLGVAWQYGCKRRRESGRSLSSGGRGGCCCQLLLQTDTKGGGYDDTHAKIGHNTRERRERNFGQRQKKKRKKKKKKKLNFPRVATTTTTKINFVKYSFLIKN